MITCYFGKLGQGKTYAMTEQVLRELDRGRIVYVNYHIEWDGVERFFGFVRRRLPKDNLRYFRDVEQFFSMENALVALDEGWIYFDSYDMTRFPLRTRMKILQSRKDGLDIAYTTQRPEQVHKALRAMTNVYYECEAVKIPFWRPVFYRYDADMRGDVVRRNYSTRWVQKGEQWVSEEVEQRPTYIWPSKRVFRSFDTSEKIALDTPYRSLRHAVKPVAVDNSVDNVDNSVKV